MRVLPVRYREHLLALYGVARTIDELGDAAAGDRAAQLERFAADLRLLWAGGTPSHPALRRLLPTVAACGLAQEPFDRLIRANLQDQVVTCYPSWDALIDYCTLSAAPIGRLVLAVFCVTDPRTGVLSDQICTALQLLEHWQDVAEDRRAGRIYLPVADLRGFEVAEPDLDHGTAGPALRRLVEFETGRAEDLLGAGAALTGLLRGWARIAVCGYVAGGRAAVDSIRRTGGDVLARSARVRRRDVVRHLAAELRRARSR